MINYSSRFIVPLLDLPFILTCTNLWPELLQSICKLFAYYNVSPIEKASQFWLDTLSIVEQQYFLLLIFNARQQTDRQSVSLFNLLAAHQPPYQFSPKAVLKHSTLLFWVGCLTTRPPRQVLFILMLQSGSEKLKYPLLWEFFLLHKITNY